jgi:Reverse transcriptase (RNA-dependent DNA polymerase)
LVQHLSSALLKFGFNGSHYDPSLFIYSFPSKIVVLLIYLLIYMDDLILTSNDFSLLKAIITSLQSQFAITNLITLNYFLGIEVSPTPDGLLLTQTKYIMDLLHRANMHDSKPCNSPTVDAPSF